MLFATLDTSVRRLHFDDNKNWYCSLATWTWSLASLVLARAAKISKIKAVRSKTRISVIFSKFIEGELYMTPVIIAGIENEQENFDYTMAELASLAEAANMEEGCTI